MGRRGLRLIGLLAVPALVISACAGASTTTAPPAPTSTATSGATPIPLPSSSAQPGATHVKWYIGLGSGSQPNQLQAQINFIGKYNSTNTDNIVIDPVIVPNQNATDTLKTQIASGNGPDIVGPVGIQGRAGFPGTFLDLTSLVAKYKTDLSVYDPKLVESYKMGSDGLIGLPYTIYPGYIFYDRDLLKAQGLPDLPTKVGDTYQGQPWTWDTLAKLAMQLTIDSSGKKATDAGFNSNKIVTYGFDTQWVNDLRRFASCFGPGNYVGADGKTATLPDAWTQAWTWYYDAMWKQHFAPNNAQRNSTTMGTGTTFGTGHVALGMAWGWSVTSYGSYDANGKSTSKFGSWDMAVLPSFNGVTTSPVDADTFSILKSSKNPDAAYKAMLAIMADKDLMVAYGGLPANPADQADFLKAAQEDVTKQFPNSTPIHWDVLNEMAKYAANPTHQAPFPNYVKGTTIDQALYTKLQSAPNLDLTSTFATFKSDLQAAFDSAPAGS